MKTFLNWIKSRYGRRAEEKELLNAFEVTFSSVHGQLVIDYLIGTYYAATCNDYDGIKLAGHNGMRFVVQDILDKIDMAKNPSRYEVKVETEEEP